MSYILDAIKKAEKQRHLEQVPTLESVVAFQDEPSSGVSFKIIGVLIVVLGVIVSVWLFRAPIKGMVSQFVQSFNVSISGKEIADEMKEKLSAAEDSSIFD